MNKSPKNYFTEEWNEKFHHENKTTTWRYGLFQRLIIDHCANKDNLTLVEIGVARGGHVRHMLDNFYPHIKKLYGIDPYVDGYDKGDIFSRMGANNCGYNLHLYPFVLDYCKDEKFELIRSQTPYIVDYFEDESVDAVYIDGDHTFEGCLLDIEGWLPKIKKGGIMVGDDYNNKAYGGIREAVAKCFPAAKIQAFMGKWYYIKGD